MEKKQLMEVLSEADIIANRQRADKEYTFNLYLSDLKSIKPKLPYSLYGTDQIIMDALASRPNFKYIHPLILELSNLAKTPINGMDYLVLPLLFFQFEESHYHRINPTWVKVENLGKFCVPRELWKQHLAYQKLTLN